MVTSKVVAGVSVVLASVVVAGLSVELESAIDDGGNVAFRVVASA